CVASSARGLTSDEAQYRRDRDGKNELPRKKRMSRLQLFFNQFKSPLIYILLIAGGIKLVLRDTLDATVILVAVAVNTVIGYFQENKAENALAKLQSFISY